MHHDDAQELLAGAGIPQGVDGLVPELDLLSVESDGGLDPVGDFLSLAICMGTGQALAFLAAAPAFGGIFGGGS